MPASLPSPAMPLSPAGRDSIATPEQAQALAARAEVRRTPCGDGDLVWHAWGRGADPVVLLHGGAGSWTHWIRNIEALVRAGRRVLVPDLPGSGDSSAPPHGDDADAIPPWLEAGLARLVGAATIDLVGFSFGALVAGLLAAGHSARVRRLVLVGAPALGTGALRKVPLRSWRGEPPGPARDAIHRHNLGVFMLAGPASVDDLAVHLHGANVARDRMARRRLHQTDLLRRTLPALQCPIWGIWGEHDALYRDRLGVVADALPIAPDFRGLTVIPGAGHWVQYDAAEAFDAALSSALGGLAEGVPP